MIQLQNLESNLARHCSLACTSCNHGSAVAERWFMEPESMERDLAQLGQAAHFQFHCLQGGEPTLNKRFLEFMDVQERSGIAEHYGMLTNGTLLDRMPDGFWERVANGRFEIRVSWYPALKKETLAYMKAKGAEYRVNLRISNEFESFLHMFHDNADGGRAEWKVCPWKRCWSVHEGMFFNCPQTAFLPGQFPEKFPHMKDAPLADGVPVAGITEEKIRWMMEHEEPLRACANCTGGTKSRIKWSEERNRAQWLEKSTIPQ